jgi:ribosomal protein S27E
MSQKMFIRTFFVPAVYHPRRPRASPLWQIVTAAWATFVATYEKVHRAAMGPLRANAFAVVLNFLRCGDLASGFLRLRCPDCGDEHLLAFTCKGRHFCPSCHQRRVRQTAAWIATSVCHEVPHRQFVFTIPRVLRGIFRKTRGQISRIPDRIVPASSNQKSKINNHQSEIQTPEILIVPPTPLRTARSMRPLWRDLIRCSGGL